MNFDEIKIDEQAKQKSFFIDTYGCPCVLE